MNKIILLAALSATLLSSCKKEEKKPTAKELHYECVNPYGNTEYGYNLYYRGSLQVKTTCVLDVREKNGTYVLLVSPVARDPFYIDVNCDNGTCFNIDYPNVLGKTYGTDSLSIEDGDYKTVLISHKY